MQCSFSIVIWISIEYTATHGNSRGIDDKTKDIIQTAAAIERTVADGGDGVGDDNIGKCCTYLKRLILRNLALIITGKSNVTGEIP